jgi:tetratricopeptide (TPR) repeat protein
MQVQRGTKVGNALLLDYYDELPEPRVDEAKAWETRVRAALEKFRTRVGARYSEGTLHRLLQNGDDRTRRAAILALGLLGTMAASNAPLAAMLHDEDRDARQLAADALWSLWFRADSDRNNRELQRLAHLRDVKKRRQALDALITRAPNFAEAYNQRAILHFQLEEWLECIADCERAIKLNPMHFGAAAGMARCHMELGKHRAALKAFRLALRINPGLEEVEEAIRALENALGEEGRRDDKK